METIKKALKNKELRKRFIFTILMLAIFGIGSNIPVPGINHEVLNQIFNGENAGLFDLFNLFTGGAFQNFTLLALGVTPYITASIIVQLLTIAFPYFERLSSEGETGRKKMATITRYLALVLAVIQATGLTLGLFRKAIIDSSAIILIMIILLLSAGTAFLMWLGEQINEYGIGNGMSLLIFAGIVTRIPGAIRELAIKTSDGSLSVVADIIIAVAAILIIVCIVIMQEGVRKIPVQYAGRVVGRKMLGGNGSHLPIKVNAAGVIPIIFAMSVLQFPLTITYIWPEGSAAEFLSKYLSPSGNPGVWVYMALNIVLTIAFTFFYTNIIFKPDEVAKNLAANGGSIPGIRQGTPTEEYLRHTSNRLALLSALFLAAVSVLPTVVSMFTPVDLTFGGTSLLILVGVATDTVKQIDSRMIMDRRGGFLE